MMQALVINLGTGFLAYGKKSPFFQRAASRWCRRRLFLTRSLLLIGWPPVVYFMVQNYYRIERVLDGEAVEGVELDPFPAWFPQLWSRDGNNECRAMSGCTEHALQDSGGVDAAEFVVADQKVLLVSGRINT